MNKNCSFVPKNVHLVLKNQRICTFCTKNEVFVKKFYQNVQILEEKSVVFRKMEKFVLFTLIM